MSNSHQIDLKKLAQQMDGLSGALSHLGKTTEPQKVLIMIRQPGWSTVAEMVFASGVVESLNVQTRALGPLESFLETTAGGLGLAR